MGTDALAIINTRRSTRKFTTDPVGAADVRDLLEAAMNAPSAVNEQAWQFVVLSKAGQVSAPRSASVSWSSSKATWRMARKTASGG